MALVFALLVPAECPAPPDQSSYPTAAAHAAALLAAARCRCHDLMPDAERDGPSAELEGPDQLRCACRLHDGGRFVDALVVYDRWLTRFGAAPELAKLVEEATRFRDRAARCVPREQDTPGSRCPPPSCEALREAAADASGWQEAARCFAERAEAGERGAHLSAARAFERAGDRADALAAYRRHLDAGADAEVERHLDAEFAGRLTVRCSPSDAVAWVGERHGQCPIAELALPDGEHTVTVRAAGHRPSSRVVRLGHDERQSLSVELAPETRWAPWVTAGVAVAATGVGVGFHVYNNRAFGALKADPGDEGLRDEVDLSFGVAVGSYAVGAVFASLATWLWLDDEGSVSEGAVSDGSVSEEVRAWRW